MARIEVPMPQMGESIAEGTISKWLKQAGDLVERDEPILEISTDKVDAEIPAPSAGTLVELFFEEGETVEVGTVVAHIEPEGDLRTALATSAGEGAEIDSASGTGTSVQADTRVPAVSDTDPPEEASTPELSPSLALPALPSAIEQESDEERVRRRSTPVVRRIAEEHGIDIKTIPGTGHSGRVTKQDILNFIGSQGTTSVSLSTGATGSAAAHDLAGFWPTFYGEVEHPEYPVRQADRVEPMDKIRRLTAEHMVLAKRVAPHVNSLIEIDFSVIDRIRADSRIRWSAQGARVSYTAFVIWAVSRVLRDFPTVNSVVSGNNIIYRGNVNLGIAVDLDPGLIVPVIHDADHLGLLGIGNKIVDLAARARDRKLMPKEIQGATFTITNPGVMGTIVGMPVIPKGTSAILGTGAIEKRVVVVTDPETGTNSTAIRNRAFFALSYDHRIVDGADAARFLASLKETLESFPEDA